MLTFRLPSRAQEADNCRLVMPILVRVGATSLTGATMRRKVQTHWLMWTDGKEGYRRRKNMRTVRVISRKDGKPIPDEQRKRLADKMGKVTFLMDGTQYRGKGSSQSRQEPKRR